jgi:hypothetical protein
VRRFLAFKYEPKESKQSKIERLMRLIRERTGVSRSVAENIADAVIRKRDIPRLSIQKHWPVEDDAIIGPSGTITFKTVAEAL